jgi:hypothetical protein
MKQKTLPAAAARLKEYLLMILAVLAVNCHAQEWYSQPHGIKSRVSSFENINGIECSGAKTNKGAKGNAFEWMSPGESKTLLDVQAAGIIQRIWLTVSQDKPLSRHLRLTMWWDNDTVPAVDVPLIDFFGFHMGERIPFESAAISSPEGRSYNCYIPMPFHKAAKIVLTNESTVDAYKLFYDVDFIEADTLPSNTNYFHAYWTRQRTSAVGDDFLVLPETKGSGRFLGMSVGIFADSVYNGTWWGEGEVKMYLDGDNEFPTIAGTGAEDYAGTGWGMGTYSHRYQGCTYADHKKGRFSFYRWHIPDAIYFSKKIKITLQQIGGGPKDVVKALVNKGVPLLPVTIDSNEGFIRLLDLPQAVNINDKDFFRIIIKRS